MNLDVCNGLLEAIALFNDGSNHAATYTMQTLPAATSLDASLAAYFSAMSTSRVPAQPAEEWHIRTRELDGGEAFRQIARNVCGTYSIHRRQCQALQGARVAAHVV